MIPVIKLDYLKRVRIDFTVNKETVKISLNKIQESMTT